MHIRTAATAVAALAAVASPALAAADLTRSSAGYTYFNRPGADLEIHDADLRACETRAFKMVQPDTHTTGGAGYGIIGAIVAGVIEGAINGMYERRGVAANIENCMVVKGWRVVRMSETEGAEMAALAQPQRANRLAGLVGADETQGEVVRIYENDVAGAGAVMFGPSGDLDKVSLSVTGLAPVQPEEKVERPKLPKMAKTARPPKASAPAKLGPVPPGYGVIVVRLRGSRFENGQMMSFVREGPDSETPAWTDGHPGSLTASLPAKFFAKADLKLDKVDAFAAPAGRWRLAGMTQGLYGLSFCLGAPAFDLAPGEVVFDGDFDLTRQSTPVVDIDAARAALGAAPALAAQVRPATYVNGVEGDCEGAYLYAYEMEGAPKVAPPPPAEVQPAVAAEPSQAGSAPEPAVEP